MKRNYLIIILSFVFIGINALLVYLDDGKVDRVSYIKDWTHAEEQDMYEKIHTQGVIDYFDEENVYFDPESGAFEEFLVEEGENVAAGDPIFTYKIQDYHETLATIRGKQDTLEGEITSIESAIDKMESYEVPEKIMEYIFIEEKEDGDAQDTKTMEVPDNAVEAELMKEQFITEREQELGGKEAQLDAVKTQIEELASGDETVKVESPYAGRVTELSKSLDNPVMTIQPMDMHVEGELTEEERKQVRDNMVVEIDIDGNDEKLEGLISDVSEYPESTSVQGESVYPFHVAFSDMESDEVDDTEMKDDVDYDEADDDGAGNDVDNGSDDDVEDGVEDDAADGTENGADKGIDDNAGNDEDDAGFDGDDTENDVEGDEDGTDHDTGVETGNDTDDDAESDSDDGVDGHANDDMENDADVDTESDVDGGEDGAENDVDAGENGEEAEDLLAGYHTTLTIQLKESLEATTLDHALAKNGFVWEMTVDGTLQKQPIEKDIQMGSVTEITDGLKPGDWIAEAPSRQFHPESTFITPLKWSDLDARVFKSKQWKKGFLSGLLMR